MHRYLYWASTKLEEFKKISINITKAFIEPLKQKIPREDFCFLSCSAVQSTKTNCSACIVVITLLIKNTDISCKKNNTV